MELGTYKVHIQGHPASQRGPVIRRGEGLHDAPKTQGRGASLRRETLGGSGWAGTGGGGGPWGTPWTSGTSDQGRNLIQALDDTLWNIKIQIVRTGFFYNVFEETKKH